MTDSTPKYSEVQQQQLKRLGESLLALTPEKRQEALRIAGNLLALKAKKRAQSAAEEMPTPERKEARSEAANADSGAAHVHINFDALLCVSPSGYP